MIVVKCGQSLRLITRLKVYVLSCTVIMRKIESDSNGIRKNNCFGKNFRLNQSTHLKLLHRSSKTYRQSLGVLLDV